MCYLYTIPQYIRKSEGFLAYPKKGLISEAEPLDKEEKR